METDMLVLFDHGPRLLSVISQFSRRGISLSLRDQILRLFT